MRTRRTFSPKDSLPSLVLPPPSAAVPSTLDAEGLDAGVFSAGTPQAVDLFFTRRIGIDTLGNPVAGAGVIWAITEGNGGIVSTFLDEVAPEQTGQGNESEFNTAKARRTPPTRSRCTPSSKARWRSSCSATAQARW